MSDVERGDYLRASLTGRQYRVGAIDTERAVVVSERPCMTFAVPTSELAKDVATGRIEVVRR